MKFVDEATIQVIAGMGGSGSASFRREKYIPYGGPDGGDGGRGGSIILVAESGLNTLVDFRHAKIFKAENGHAGSGRQKYGKGGADNIIRVPLGTLVYSVETEELMGDLVEGGQQLVVARGGKGGLGNLHFKSSTNRSPRRFTPGVAGEKRELRLELKVLADVGLLGFPNAGKSTLISAVSAAHPKIADYPFTTLYPNLGVVSVDHSRSFVIADIPGLVEGAADGAGLGIQFLKHLQRTRILLHLVELAPMDGSDPAAQVRSLVSELDHFSTELALRPRWLVFSKADLMDSDTADQKARELVAELRWQGTFHVISSVTGQGTQHLMQNVMTALEQLADEESAAERGPASDVEEGL